MFKILTVFIIIFCSVVKAQQYDATIYFLDGSKKTGKADGVENGESKLAFIENGSKKKEKIKVELIDKIQYINPKSGQPVTVELRECVYYFLSDKPKTEFCWIKKISTGEISSYIGYSYDGGIRDAYHYTVTPSQLMNMFFQYKNEKPQLIYFNNSTWTPNKKQIIKRQVKNFFKNICPKLVNDFDEGKLEIKNNNPEILLEYYEKNCKTTN